MSGNSILRVVVWLIALIGFGSAAGQSHDYSNFKHSSEKHASISCTACHQRSDNAAQPSFPGHSACINCHRKEFFTSQTPLCSICHTDVSSNKPPLKAFPTTFKEPFNAKFDHAQHLSAAVRPKNGCAACHAGSRAAAMTIPATLNAHSQCYSCHTQGSKSTSGRDLAACGVCHEQKNYQRTSTNALAFRAAFSHVKHGPKQRLECSACHTVTAGLPQSRQVSSPKTAEHFAAGSGQSCLSCHNGKRAFGGDLAFNDCRRCHTGGTFRMPGRE